MTTARQRASLPWSRPRGPGSEQPDDDNWADNHGNAAEQTPGKHILAVVPTRDLVEVGVGQLTHFAVFVLQDFSCLGISHGILLLLPTGKRYRFRLSVVRECWIVAMHAVPQGTCKSGRSKNQKRTNRAGTADNTNLRR